MKQMLTVAITGRSGSGKSLVTAYYEKKGYPVAYSDAISREVTGPGSACLAELADAFGPSILAKDGSLRRDKLAKRVFSSPQDTKRLVNITHPYIIGELLRRRDAARQTGAKLFFADGAIIVGAPFEAYCDLILVVTAETHLAMSRIILRDGISKTAAAARLEAQPSEQELCAAADYVLENNGSEAALYRKADQALEKMLLFWQAQTAQEQ